MIASKERPLRILAADDSAVMRSILRTLFLSHARERNNDLPRMELAGIAHDGLECLESIARLHPDALVLDLEMPRLDGLGVLERLIQQKLSLPVIMCSSHTQRGARATFDALARGASDYIMKPVGQPGIEDALRMLSEQLLPKLAALVAVEEGRSRYFSREHVLKPNQHPLRSSASTSASPPSVVVIGASTGGPPVLEELLSGFIADFPVPVLITQHMPKLFTGVLAARLKRCCRLDVEEARHGEPLTAGKIWLAPGDRHLEVMSPPASGHIGYDPTKIAVIKLHSKEPLNHYRPAVDYLFHSAARIYGSGVLALVLTGMGSDGLDGARAIHKCGGTILAQDESTSAVWGMPGRVAEAGIAAGIMSIPEMAREVNSRVSSIRSFRSQTPTRHPMLLPCGEAAHGMY